MSDTSTIRVCPKCGSDNIEEQVIAWVDPNTLKVTESEWGTVPWDDRYCCNDCNHQFNEPDQTNAPITPATATDAPGLASIADVPMVSNVRAMPDGEANFWMLNISRDWVCRVQFNGSASVQDQQTMAELMAGLLSRLVEDRDVH